MTYCLFFFILKIIGGRASAVSHWELFLIIVAIPPSPHFVRGHYSLSFTYRKKHYGVGRKECDINTPWKIALSSFCFCLLVASGFSLIF